MAARARELVLLTVHSLPSLKDSANFRVPSRNSMRVTSPIVRYAGPSAKSVPFKNALA